jgi:glucokinase
MQHVSNKDFLKDERIVLTLDAGGTNLVFSAIRSGEEIIEPINFPSQPDDLAKCLHTMVEGFGSVQQKLSDTACAISFAFPGPADYVRGIIGDLPNLPAFRGGVPLGPYLEKQFQLPVFINNDGNLFTLGEAHYGFLPWVNQLIRTNGGEKQYQNLVGITLGTGFGGGVVLNGQLLIGDNSSAAEIWSMRNYLRADTTADSGVGRRNIKEYFAQKAGLAENELIEPKEIYEIAAACKPGDRSAALETFKMQGKVAGDIVANILAVVDGLVVIGGGLSGAAEFFLPSFIAELNGQLRHYQDPAPRLEYQAFNLEDPHARETFVHGRLKMIPIPETGETIPFDQLPRTGIGLSKLGTSKATAIGAYVFALQKLDSK